MNAPAFVIATLLASFIAALAHSAPDEDKLGKAQGYPVGNARTWFFDEKVRVGSFSAQGEIGAISGGVARVMAPADKPMPLPKAAQEPTYRWSVADAKNLSVDDYLARQRVMGLLIIKDGVIQVERYQYERTPQHRFVSQSMAKSLMSLAIGIALRDGKIKSLDDRADLYAPALKGTLMGETSVRNLLRMASGAKFVEDYSGKDDSARFAQATTRMGIEAAAATITEREVPQGTRFAYFSAHTQMLSAVLRGATGRSASEYLTPRLWQAIGAETSAIWWSDKTGITIAGGNFNATLRDYARLGIVLANDGVRPDDPAKRAIIARDYLLDATDWHRVDPPFRPGFEKRYWGYGHQFWLFPGETRRFALLGVYGQTIFVDPQLKLIMVQTTANATARADETSLAKERDAFWRGLVRHYGAW